MKNNMTSELKHNFLYLELIIKHDKTFYEDGFQYKSFGRKHFFACNKH